MQSLMLNSGLIRLSVVTFATVLLASCGGSAPKSADHTSFESPDAAVAALVAALEADDTAKLNLLFGPGSEELLSSGDPVADSGDRKEFLAAYAANHALIDGEGGEKVLQMGVNDWQFPVPLEQRDGRWYFNGAEGADELIYRRVGNNELGAIAVCRGYVDAQNEYASEGRDGDVAGVYAAYVISDEGRHNGLYWPTADDEPASPAGPWVASAASEGYRRAASGEPTPYHGYYYRMLYAQGANAAGGAKEYFVDGRLIDGFAMIAWPADYGVSGVKTFIVNQDGTVYEKDLGEDTATAITTIELFDPDDSWKPVPKTAE
jgi:hypothetical protein